MNTSRNGVVQSAEMDLGLRSYMLGTYKYMMMAMALAAVVAYGFGMYVIKTPNGHISSFGQLLVRPGSALLLTFGIMMAFGGVGAKLHSMSVQAVKIFLFGFAAVMGVWLSVIAAFVDPMISVRIFFMAAAAFAGVSLFGYMTKKNLNAIVGFFIMVFAGFIVINLVGMFFPALALTGTAGFIFNLVGLVAICGITAWETQNLKRMYYGTTHDADLAEKTSVFGAASLLLSFINIFSILMSLFGDR